MAKKTIQGIKYLLDASKRTAEVIANNYYGNICILPTVVDNNIKYNVTSIGDHAFRNCSKLTSIAILDGLERIGKLAFAECSSLTSITIPKTVTQIESGRVDIGENVYYGHLFTNCPSLTSIVVAKGNPIYKTIQNGNGIIDTTTNTLIAGDQTTSIPKGGVNIGEYAFAECKALTSVTIPDSVTSIGNGAFSNCGALTSVTIGNSVTTIGQSAFRNCKQLNSITIPDSVTSIGNGAFSNCGALTSVTIGNSVTTIGQSAFRNCKQLNSITIPNSVTNIGYWAFAHCDQLNKVIIGHKFTGIGDVFNGAGRPGDNGQDFGRPLEETERKKRNKPIIKAIQFFLKALNKRENKTPHDYEYLLGQTIRQYEPAENHQHVSIGAWEYWKIQASDNEDIRQFQYDWTYEDTNNKSIEFNKEFIQEHTTPVADIKEKLKKLINKNSRSIKKILEQMHISRILKTEDKAIKKNSGRGLDFEEIANSTVCYLGAGIEFQCSEHKIGYEAFKGCTNLKNLEIGCKKICRTKVKNLKKGKRITIP